MPVRGSLRTRAAALLVLLLPSGAFAETVTVSTGPALAGAMAAANPGDTIVLMPGEYRLGGNTTNIQRPGSAARPITVRAAQPGKARIRSETTELFKVFAPHWIFEGLDIVGTNNSYHAFHVVGGAEHVAIRGNRMRNFHAAIKGNFEGGKDPSDIVIEGNVIFNDSPRKTDEPVTPVDVVHGQRWVLRDNFVADFAKDGGDETSYGAFLKGGSADGIFERNLVICEWRHTGGFRVGLSFGGGGSPPEYWTSDREEHARGIMRNNIILNCPNGEGIYLNRSGGAKIYNNTIYNAYGILARFPATGPSDVRNNIVSGAIATRAEGQLAGRNNIETGRSIGDYIPGVARSLKLRISDYDQRWPSIFTPDRIAWASSTIDGIAAWLGRSSLGRGVSEFHDWFADPKAADFERRDTDRFLQRGQPVADVETDFCGQRRLGATDLGAIEYTAGTCDSRGWLTAKLARFN